jgi:hypothetical protein
MQGHIMRIALFAAAAALLAAVPAAAQPNRSDMTGPGFAGSGVAGVGYHGAAFRDIDNALFRRAEGRVVFRSPAIACRVAARAALEAVELRDGRLRPPRRWENAAPFQPQAQADVAALLTEEGTGTPAARRVLAALRGGVPGEPGDEPEQLVAALAGLFREGDGLVCPARERWVAGERWAAALQAYEFFVREAPDASLDPISPELAIIGVVLRDLVDAGLAAPRG